jgi:predicted metallopeptidase
MSLYLLSEILIVLSLLREVIMSLYLLSQIVMVLCLLSQIFSLLSQIFRLLSQIFIAVFLLIRRGIIPHHAIFTQRADPTGSAVTPVQIRIITSDLSVVPTAGTAGRAAPRAVATVRLLQPLLELSHQFVLQLVPHGGQLCPISSRLVLLTADLFHLPREISVKFCCHLVEGGLVVRLGVEVRRLPRVHVGLSVRLLHQSGLQLARQLFLHLSMHRGHLSLLVYRVDWIVDVIGWDGSRGFVHAEHLEELVPLFEEVPVQLGQEIGLDLSSQVLDVFHAVLGGDVVGVAVGPLDLFVELEGDVRPQLLLQLGQDGVVVVGPAILEVALGEVSVLGVFEDLVQVLVQFCLYSCGDCRDGVGDVSYWNRLGVGLHVDRDLSVGVGLRADRDLSVGVRLVDRALLQLPRIVVADSSIRISLRVHRGVHPRVVIRLDLSLQMLHQVGLHLSGQIGQFLVVVVGAGLESAVDDAVRVRPPDPLIPVVLLQRLLQPHRDIPPQLLLEQPPVGFDLRLADPAPVRHRPLVVVVDRPLQLPLHLLLQTCRNLSQIRVDAVALVGRGETESSAHLGLGEGRVASRVSVLGVELAE